MLATRKNAGAFQPLNEFPRVTGGRVMIGRNRARAHYFIGGREAKIQDRGEVSVESESPALLADQPAVLTKQACATRLKNLPNRRCGRDDVAQTVDSAAFHVNTSEQSGFDDILAIAQQPMHLISAINVPGEQDNPPRLDGIEQGLYIRRDGRAFEAYDHQLSHLQMKVVHYDFNSFLRSCSKVKASSGVKRSRSASRNRSAIF